MQTICLNARVLGTFILMLSVEDLTDDLLQRKLSTTYTLSTAMEVSYKAIKSTTLVKVLKCKKEAFIYHSHPPPHQFLQHLQVS